MPEKPEHPPGEVVFNVLLLVLGVAALVEAVRLGGVARLSGAGFFPMLAALVMLGSAGVLLVQRLRRTASSGSLGEVVPLRLVVVVVLIAAYVALMPLLGFMPATGLFLLVMLLYLWRRGLWRSLAVTAASLLVVQLVFREVFQVVLPTGTLLPAGFW